MCSIERETHSCLKLNYLYSDIQLFFSHGLLKLKMSNVSKVQGELVYTGNHIDKEFRKKNAQQQENCTRQSQVLFELL